MTPTVTGSWQASRVNQSSRPSNSQKPTFKTKRADQNSFRLRITRKTSQKSKKCPATITTTHHKSLPSQRSPVATTPKATSATASVTENRNPQDRGETVAEACVGESGIFTIAPELLSRR